LKTVLFALNGSYSHTNLAVRAIGAHLVDSGIQTVIIEKSLKDTRLSVLATRFSNLFTLSIIKPIIPGFY
jgi:hypothetical protein